MGVDTQAVGTETEQAVGTVAAAVGTAAVVGMHHLEADTGADTLAEHPAGPLVATAGIGAAVVAAGIAVAAAAEQVAAVG